MLVNKTQTAAAIDNLVLFIITLLQKCACATLMCGGGKCFETHRGASLVIRLRINVMKRLSSDLMQTRAIGAPSSGLVNPFSSISSRIGVVGHSSGRMA